MGRFQRVHIMQALLIIITLNHIPPYCGIYSPLCLFLPVIVVVAVRASWFFALCWLWLRVTPEFHTWCVCDPMTSSCALILLAERLLVPCSKVPLESTGQRFRLVEMRQWSLVLLYTVWPQNRSSQAAVHVKWKSRVQCDRQMRTFKRNRISPTILPKLWVFQRETELWPSL